MKILFPMGRFYPSQVGGPANTVYWHTCALKQKGILSEIITTTVGISEEEVLMINHFFEASCGNIYYGKGGELNFNSIWNIWKKVKSVDLIHLNSLFSFFSLTSFFFIILLNRSKKVVISPRGELSLSALMYGKRKKKVVLFFYKLFVNKILFHSTAKKETLEIKSIFNGAKIVEIPNLIMPSKRLKLNNKKKQFLYIGRIHPIKSIDKLLEAIVLSEKFKLSKFNVIIAGVHVPNDQVYYDQLNNFIIKNNLEERVKFIGQVIGEEKEKLYAESYFTFLPSETENFGNVVLESLNQGTPVVASLGTPWGILETFVCGFHISNNSNSLASKIDEILNLDLSSYCLMSENCQKLVDTNFSVEKRIQEWVKVYEDLIN